MNIQDLAVIALVIFFIRAIISLPARPIHRCSDVWTQEDQDQVDQLSPLSLVKSAEVLPALQAISPSTKKEQISLISHNMTKSPFFVIDGGKN